MKGTRRGLSLRCDLSGLLLEVVRDDSLLWTDALIGTHFASFVDRLSMARALDFVVEIKRTGAAFDCELIVPGADGPGTMYFMGGRSGDSMLISGCGARDGTLALYEELSQLNSEQTDLVRGLSKNHAGSSPGTPRISSGDAFMYDEISRLNNELVSAQRDLAKKNAELERLDELKNRFLGMAVHDLRSPLSVLMTYTEFLMDEASTALGPEMTDLLAQMRASVDFMLTLVDDLLDTSAIESGKLRLDPKPIDLAPLALIAVSSMRVLAAKRRIHIDFRAETGLPLVMADAHRSRQVMDNLLSNALKYTESGGAVEMSVDLVLPFVRVSVRDHGPGISPENMHTLLSPFGTTTVRSPSGEKSTGLGLLITKRIIEGHGGKFNLTNASPDGTLAELYFPIHEKSHA